MAGIPAELLAPPSGGVRPPVEPRAELAPLDALSWSDFERLCVALAREDGEPEHVQRYGGPGQNQQGIDVYARRASGRYRVYQCKRYQQLGAADLRRLVDTFLAGTWANRAEALVVCTSASAVRTERAEAIEEQARRVRTRGVSLEIWDADELSRRLKELPVVVLDFFGRAWVSRLCTVGLPESAARRLDVDELQRLRSRLGCSKGGEIEWVHWGTGTARLLPRLLRLPDGSSCSSGPLFLASRKPVPARRPPARDICPHTGRARLGYDRARILLKDLTGWQLHQLRHSAATHLGDQKVPLQLIMAKTRHKSPRTAMRYVNPSPTAVAEVTELLDPPRRKH